jgi:hypothetical protein
MNKPYDKIEDIEQIAEMAQLGEDVSEYFTGQYVAKQQVSVDFPLSLLSIMDEECQRLGITRQAWIIMVCKESLKQIQKNGNLLELPVASARHR